MEAHGLRFCDECRRSMPKDETSCRTDDGREVCAECFADGREVEPAPEIAAAPAPTPPEGKARRRRKKPIWEWISRPYREDAERWAATRALEARIRAEREAVEEERRQAHDPEQAILDELRGTRRETRRAATYAGWILAIIVIIIAIGGCLAILPPGNRPW